MSLLSEVATPLYRLYLSRGRSKNAARRRGWQNIQIHICNTFKLIKQIWQALSYRISDIRYKATVLKCSGTTSKVANILDLDGNNSFTVE